MPSTLYSKPSPTGGRLIREVISFLRSQSVDLPLGAEVLIATSGGSDSVALAHLLIHYGRRISPKDRIQLLHINHHWRGKESDQDAAFVEECARKWAVPLNSVNLQPSVQRKQSWEENARQARREIYDQFIRQAGRKKALILTAHHADDLAETMVWRLFTGAAESHGGGILFRHGDQLRPLLRVRKTELRKYLLEEGQTWREDSTNASDQLLRARMRKDLMSKIEDLFPQAVGHLVSAALGAQARSGHGNRELLPAPELLFQASGIKARRAHWTAIKNLIHRDTLGELHLPGGWKLSRESRRWTLERI